MRRDTTYDSINALGFVEVIGLTAAIEAADAMLKSAQVRLLRQLLREPVQTTIIVEGSLGACSAAVDAGRAAAERMDALVTSHVMGRPANDTADFVLRLAEAGQAPFAPPPPPAAKPAPAARPMAAPLAKPLATAPAAVVRPAVHDEVVAAVPEPAAQAAPAADRAKSATPDDDKLLAALAGLPGGYGAQSLARRVGGTTAAVRQRLEALCASGQLVKRGSRYLLAKPERNGK